MPIETSTYRQSGWRRLDNGVVEKYYGTSVPTNPEAYVKEWDNVVNETIEKTPYVAPATDAPQV